MDANKPRHYQYPPVCDDVLLETFVTLQTHSMRESASDLQAWAPERQVCQSTNSIVHLDVKDLDAIVI